MEQDPARLPVRDESGATASNSRQAACILYGGATSALQINYVVSQLVLRIVEQTWPTKSVPNGD